MPAEKIFLFSTIALPRNERNFGLPQKKAAMPDHESVGRL